MIILAIETSCDDTCLALVELKRGQMKTCPELSRKVLADFVSSQIKIHAPFGGVVPHLAARAHWRNLPILLEKILAKIELRKIDLLAVTIGPGLEPSLWAGIRMARILALSLEKPIVGVNHLEGHIAANWLKPIGGISNFQFPISKHLFPAICLIVSGGHTQLVLIKDFGQYKVIGQTLDDAAGEAFDKVAKLLGLEYPGGPVIAQLAQKGKANAFDLPRPMIHSQDYNFSFSGLKTAVLYLTKKLSTLNYQLKINLSASFQQAIIDVLITKTIKVAKEYRVKTVMLSGGVAANLELRRQMNQRVKSQIPNCQFLVPNTKFCTDNAIMIALAGWWQYLKNGPYRLEKIVAKANLKL